jgi:hypothetical protein
LDLARRSLSRFSVPLLPKPQFKQEGIGQHGVGDQFKDVTTWDPDIAGTVHVWLDPADGKTYAVNGHRRTDLAQRLGVPELQVRYLDAKDAQEARAKGAMINIAEGNGTAIDAAKFFRDSGKTPESLATEGKLSMRKQVAKQGMALANLSEPIFNDVVHGLLPVERAAVLGAGVPNHADQQALYTLIRQRESGGKRLTNDQIEELIRMNNRTATVTESSADKAQGGLFGVEEMTRSLLPEKAVLSDYVRKQLSAEKKLFGAVSTEAAAERLGQAGNVIQASTNAQSAQAANQGSMLYDRLSTKAGPIDGILDRAAQSLAKGENAHDVKQGAYREIRDHLKAQLDQLEGSGGRTEGVRQERSGQVGSGEPHPMDAGRIGADDSGAAGALPARPEVKRLFGSERGSISFKPAKNSPDEPGLFDSASEQQSQIEAQRSANQLTHDQLTAQIKSGLAAKPTKLKPAENRGLFDEETPESGSLFGSERGSLSLKPIRQTPEQLKAAADKRYGENVREWFTARRDLWSARVHQEMDRLRKSLPDAVDREGLYLMRDFRNKPGELKQWLAGTHAAYGEVPRLDIARENVEKLRPAIERALDPTPAMKAADQTLTRIAEVSLREGQRLGFIEHHVSPDEHVTHLLGADEEGKPPSIADRMGKAMGGKIGLNFPFNQERNFPTILDAIAHNQRPKTIDALKAFDTYGDKFATARATHMLIEQLRDSDTGIWGTKSDKNIPKGWVEIAAHAHPFRNLGAYMIPEGQPVAAYQTLFVPPKIEQGLRPITDPDYSNRIAGFGRLRIFQSYTKAAQLGLSFFHATTENYMALANMGARGWFKGLKADRDAPGFLEQEADFIGHGGTTSIQGKTYEAAEGLTVSSLPTAGEAWRSLPGIHQVDQAAQKITDFTFGKMQRQFKVVDYALHKAAWLAQHPQSMPLERTAAMKSMAKEINAVYGGCTRRTWASTR